MVDVLGAQQTQLQTRIATSRDFEAIKAAHDKFLATLEAQTLLHVPVVSRALDDIFDICRKFCVLVQKGDSASGRVPAGDAKSPDPIVKLCRDYERAACFLFTILQQFQNKQSAPHLSQLLLRIDFNRHFSRMSARMGAAQMPPQVPASDAGGAM